ncbi:ADOP family duplicated permease [Terracidiphilus gabretensis]|uniref:ADOP family duplicated permease n=1 Tax=Terracidiphilus gabretensis TaxID=1577687 RepID=UPI00071B35D7|nr:ADOP family duplicated permease [Terracidiphilus gabretensis]
MGLGFDWERRKNDLREELETHLRIAIEERIARGESPEAARAAAMRELGNRLLVADVTRSAWGWLWMERIGQDLRYAIRRLLGSPGFTVTVLLTLALGIGANLAVFQLVYSVILADLPVPHPEELVAVHAARTPFDEGWAVSYAAYQRLRAATPEAPLLARASVGLADLEIPNRVSAKPSCDLVSDNYFSVLGVTPAAGRLFIQADDTLGQSEWPAVLRYDFARDTFGSAQQAVGQHMLLNGRAFVVIGVAKRRFLDVVIGYAPDIWLPLALQSTGVFTPPWDSLGPGHDVTLSKPWHNQPTIFWLALIARIPPERRAAVAAHWDQVFRPDRELMTEATVDPDVKAALLRATTDVVPLNHGNGGMRRRFLTPLVLLMALSASIFLVGCLNLANLQLARLNARAHELGVRMALGASGVRLLCQIVLEDVLMVVAGFALAFVMGRISSGMLIRWASNHNSPLTIDLHTSLPIAVLGVSLMLLSLLFFSILPALIFMRTGVTRAAGSRARVAGIAQTGRQRWRANLLLITQVSLSLLLSSMSFCFASTLVHWETVDVGMDREHVLLVRSDMDETRYADHRDRLPALYLRMQERLQALPGVRSAAVGMCGGIHCGWNTAIYVHGRGDLTNGQVHGQEDHVSRGFFTTTGIPFLRGRDFSSTDTDKTQTVAIISRSYAHQLFGDNDPIGQRVGYEPAPNDHKFLIVGEVADAHVNGPQLEAPPMVYMSINQNPAPVHGIRVRVIGDPRALSESVRQALHEVDPTLPIDEMVPFSMELSGDLGTEKLLARLAGIYASLTLLLVTIGFYGVMSSRTSRRKSEFGIRLALGATRRHVQMLIVSQAAWILVVGIGLGLLLSVAAIRLASHLLYGSAVRNSAAIFAASVALAITGFAAAFIPARRAAYVDPLETLRNE